MLGNPREFKVLGQPSAMLVDTSTGNTIAGCTNAEFNHIAYAGFESNYAGNWSGINSGNIVSTGGLTGVKYYQQTSFSISKSGLTNSAYYTISYWSKNGSYTVSGNQSGYPKTLRSVTIGGNTWTLYEHLCTGQTTITISGTGAIDELRLHPRDARMTTYAYKPLVGIISACDPNNMLGFYVYDAFGRLSVIKDQNGFIIKQFCYNYAGQSVNCSW